MAGLTQSSGESIFGSEAEVSEGKSSLGGDVGSSPLCPQCGSAKVWRDGHRQSIFGDDFQRWLCRVCGLRFSDQNDIQRSWSMAEKTARIGGMALKSEADYRHNRQICVKETKNLVVEHQETEVLRRNDSGEFNGKIAEYIWWLKKEGYAEATIVGRSKLLKILHRRGANLYDPDSVKDTIAKQKWSEGRKANSVDAYSSFLKMVGGQWDPPHYEGVRKIPFIPAETEIDQLIAACSPRMATFLQLLKETGARCGEIWTLKWDDIDFVSKVVNITPEKGSNPRVNALSCKLIGMLQGLARNYGRNVFANPGMPVDHHATHFSQQRKRIAQKIGNPRIVKIHFHTFRYWRGTMLYHQYRSEYYVMKQLGHKNIENTLLYIQLEEALFKGTCDYISKVARTEKEICNLIEDGFEYVTDFEGAKIFRKRKF